MTEFDQVKLDIVDCNDPICMIGLLDGIIFATKIMRTEKLKSDSDFSHITEYDIAEYLHMECENHNGLLDEEEKVSEDDATVFSYIKGRIKHCRTPLDMAIMILEIENNMVLYCKKYYPVELLEDSNGQYSMPIYIQKEFLEHEYNGEWEGLHQCK